MTRGSETDGGVESPGALLGDRSFRGPVDPGAGHDHGTDHLALVYESRPEQFDAVAPFLRRGLERGERCVYVADDNSREAVRAGLRERGVDVDAARNSGALTFLTPAETYWETGAFDRDAMLAFWEDALDDARDEGFSGIRAAAEMTWALDDDTTPGELVQYESLLNPLYENDDYTVLCQYDRNQFPDDVIHDVIETHPFVVQDGTVSRNVYYSPPEKFFGPERPTEKVDRKLRTLRDRTTSKTTLRDHKRYLHDLYEIIADPERGFEEKLQALFDLGCERFDADIGALARVDPDTDHFEVEATNGDHPDLVPGSEFPLSETYCRVTASERGTCTVTDPSEFEGRLCYERFGVRSYLGTFLEFEDNADRTFWFVSEDPREEFSDADRTFHHLMGQLLAYELERDRRTAELVTMNNLSATARDVNRALVQQSTREEMEQVVCDRLGASESYADAWFASVDDGDVTPSTTASEGDLYGDADTPTPGDLTRSVVETGDPQFATDLATRPDDRPGAGAAADLAAGAAVPVAYGDDVHGVLTVYTTRASAFSGEERAVLTQLGEITGMAMAALQYKREMEYERDRLEFFNRLVRHNILNGLSVVGARAQLLDGAVEESGVEHLETIRGRTEDMISLVEDLRSLIQAVLETGDHSLEPTPLAEVLENEVRRARRTFSDAEFVVEGDVESREVLANDLLEEVFENLLTNAVRHNDRGTPRVRIRVEADAETVTVHVADNGPGIPADIRDRVFEKGVKGLDSPGSGFGLHLVREIVDTFDGDISVAERESRGTTVSVTLQPAGNAASTRGE